MKQSITRWVWIGAVAWVSPLGAHHSESMFEPLPQWINGRIVEFARINPHSVITLEETTASGASRRWAIEGPDPARLDRRGLGPDFLVAGDEVSFCTFPLKQEFASRNAQAPPFVHGKVIIMPDGTMEIWGSYGMLTNCVGPENQIQRWVDFVNSNALAWTAWCRRFSNLPPRADSHDLVAEISRLMTNRCD
jgi:hypothetical protein